MNGCMKFGDARSVRNTRGPLVIFVTFSVDVDKRVFY